MTFTVDYDNNEVRLDNRMVILKYKSAITMWDVERLLFEVINQVDRSGVVIETVKEGHGKIIGEW